MDRGKAKEQLLEELIRMQKDIKEKVEAQERFISRLQLLIQMEGLFSQVIENLPYPVAIFKQDGILCMANNRMMKETGLEADEILMGKINFLNRVTNENDAILEAVEDVFLGETIMLQQLSYPLALFCRSADREVSDIYQSAVLFPVTDRSDHIVFGAVMLMK